MTILTNLLLFIFVCVFIHMNKTKDCIIDTLKGIRGVRLDNQKVFRAPGPKIKYFERFFFVVQFTIDIILFIYK